MENSFEELLLVTLRIVPFRKARNEEHKLGNLTHEKIATAITINENLNAYGYTLSPQDILRLAASKSPEKFYNNFKKLINRPDVLPLFPDFPKQVMSISEAQFRWQQFLHYFSVEISEIHRILVDNLYPDRVNEYLKYWTPKGKGFDKSKEDKHLLDLKVLELVYVNDVYETVLSRVLGKRERMSLNETELVLMAFPKSTAVYMRELRIPYKENVEILFEKVLERYERERAVEVLSSICQHSGDVLNNIYKIMVKRKYHFRTAEKRTFARLLEAYTAGNFRENLCMSNKRRERNLLIINHIDFSTYSKSPEHKKVVEDLRDDELRSWESKADRMLMTKAEGALDFVAKRPGIMLRKLNHILLLGYEKDEVMAALLPYAPKLDPRTILKLLVVFNNDCEISKILEEIDRTRNEYETRRREYDLDIIKRHCLNDIRKIEFGRAYRKNNTVDYLPKGYYDIYGVYSHGIERRPWLDPSQAGPSLTDKQSAVHDKFARYRKKEIMCVCDKYNDIILRKTVRERAELKHAKKVLEALYLKKKCKKRVMRNIDYISNSLNASYSYDALSKLDREIARWESEKQKFERKIEAITSEVYELNGVYDIIAVIERKYEHLQFLAPMIVKKVHFDELLKESVEKCKGSYIYNIARQKAERRRRAIENAKCAPERIKAINEEEKIVIAGLEEKLAKERLLAQKMQEKREIFIDLLRAYFSVRGTSLKDRKVLLKLNSLDLEHSLIETNEKSADSTYIRSGLAVKIPDDVKYVRFFVFWKDKEFVDVDLHASVVGKKYSAPYLPMIQGRHHVGWNNHFRSCGAVYSGDMRGREGVEYIDVDLSGNIKNVFLNLELYCGKLNLADLDKCYVGMMAVSNIGETVSQFTPENCFFSQGIQQAVSRMHYGFIDVENRYLMFMGMENRSVNKAGEYKNPLGNLFSLKDYMDIVLESQNVTLTEDEEEAEVILTAEKNTYSNGVSLLDENFFLDAV